MRRCGSTQPVVIDIMIMSQTISEKWLNEERLAGDKFDFPRLGYRGFLLTFYRSRASFQMAFDSQY